MATREQVLGRLYEAVVGYDSDGAAKAAVDAVALKMDPVDAIEMGLAKGLREIGEKFEKGELYLPHLIMGADAMEAAIKVLESAMKMGGLEAKSRGTIVIGTVEGDIHDLGYRIVSAMLRANGFKVHEIGFNTKSMDFIDKAKETNADIIAVSSLMTTTMPFMRDLIESLQTSGLRGRFMVLVGGGPVTEQWAKEIGADGYGRDASEAVRAAIDLMKRKGK